MATNLLKEAASSTSVIMPLQAVIKLIKAKAEIPSLSFPGLLSNGVSSFMAGLFSTP